MYICNLTSHARIQESDGGSKIGCWPSNPHDDAISSHVYETKGFLSESTTSATPTHTVTLGVIYSKYIYKVHTNKVNPTFLLGYDSAACMLAPCPSLFGLNQASYH